MAKAKSGMAKAKAKNGVKISGSGVIMARKREMKENGVINGENGSAAAGEIVIWRKSAKNKPSA